VPLLLKGKINFGHPKPAGAPFFACPELKEWKFLSQKRNLPSLCPHWTALVKIKKKKGIGKNPFLPGLRPQPWASYQFRLLINPFPLTRE